MIKISGTGSYLPNDPIKNEDLSFIGGGVVNVAAAFLGLKQRHWAVDIPTNQIVPGNTNSEMATKAARRALEDARLTPQDIDLIVLGTSTPDYPAPPTVVYVQEQLNLERCAVLELRSGCVGFIQALAVAQGFLKCGQYKNILVIGSELNSSFGIPYKKGKQVSMDNKLTAYMFGDGAAAVVLQASEGESQILGTCFGSIGTGKKEGFVVKAGGSLYPPTKHCINELSAETEQDYKQVLLYGPVLIKEAITALQKVVPFKKESIRYIIPPQANINIMRIVKFRFGSEYSFHDEQVFINISRFGNTFSASLPLALDELNRGKLLKDGDLILLVGAEITKWIYGAALIRWQNTGALAAKQP